MLFLSSRRVRATSRGRRWRSSVTSQARSFSTQVLCLRRKRRTRVCLRFLSLRRRKPRPIRCVPLNPSPISPVQPAFFSVTHRLIVSASEGQGRHGKPVPAVQASRSVGACAVLLSSLKHCTVVLRQMTWTASSVRKKERRLPGKRHGEVRGAFSLNGSNGLLVAGGV